jgi:hypothetical protein
MPKVDICALDKKCVHKFQHYIGHWCFPPHHKQRNKPCFKSLVFFLINILLVLHPFYMFVIIFLVYVHMNRLGSEILIPFSISVVLSRIVHLLFTIASTSCCCISIGLWCVFTIVCAFVVYCTFNYTSMDRCSSFTTMFSSLGSFYTIYASTKCYSSTSSSFDSSMHTRSINVALGPICSLACQRCLLMRKNSIANVPIESMSWITICAHHIFSLYAFPFAHSKDDDECDSDLIANG